MEILNYSPISTCSFSKSPIAKSIKMLDIPSADLLKCGSCCTEFLLSDILVFIQHKTKPCKLEVTDSEKHLFQCSSCSQTFKCANSLLEHAQFFHKINIFVDANNLQTHLKPLNEDGNHFNSKSLESTPEKINSFDLNAYSALSNSSSYSETKETLQEENSKFKKEQDIKIDYQNNLENSISNKIFNCNNNSQNIINYQNDQNSCDSESYLVIKCEETDKEEEQNVHNRSGDFYLEEKASFVKQTVYKKSIDENMNQVSNFNNEETKKKEKKNKQTSLFFCDICNASFNQKIHLTKHSAKHTGIKPFKCTECNYSTVERSHLKVHVRVHTGEKPFKCNFCDYATAQSSTLKIHNKRHHDKLNESITHKNNNSYREMSKSDDSQASFESKNPSLDHLSSNMDANYLQKEIEMSSSTNHVNEFDSNNKRNFSLENLNTIKNCSSSSFSSSSSTTSNSSSKSSSSCKRARSAAPSEKKPKKILINNIESSQNLIKNNKSNIKTDTNIYLHNDLVKFSNYPSSSKKINKTYTKDLLILSNNIKLEESADDSDSITAKIIPVETVVISSIQLTEAENKLLGLANIALERETN